MSVEKFEGGILLPSKRSSLHAWWSGGVLTRTKEYVDISSQIAEGMSNRVLGAYSFHDRDVLHSEEKVIYMNCFFSKHWGHFLLDMIGRLWYPAFIDRNCKIAYTCREKSGTKISGNYLELIELMGIDSKRLIMVDRITQFKEVIVPESSILPGKYYMKEYVQLFDEAFTRSGAKISSEDKIYCSRSSFPAAQKKENGGDFVEKVFIDNLYKPVYMEKMTVREQIQTLNSAGEIAMLNGTLAHNLLFVRNNAKVTVINKTYLLNVHQFMINQISRSSVCYVDAYVSPMSVDYGHGPFIIRRTKEFLKYCEDNGLKVSSDDEKKASEKISVLVKIWYYLKWVKNYVLFNRKNIYGIIKGRWRETFTSIVKKCINPQIREYYKAQQKR